MKYQRFISYLYQYRDGEKLQNTGYVKVEQKGAMIRISLRSKLLEHNEPVYSIYLITRQMEAGNYGFFLDKLAPAQGLLTYQYITGQAQGFGDDLTIDDFVGVFIRGERAMYMTLWQDVEVQPENIIYEGNMDYMADNDNMYRNTDAQTLGINETEDGVQTLQTEGGQREAAASQENEAAAGAEFVPTVDIGDWEPSPAEADMADGSGPVQDSDGRLAAAEAAAGEQPMVAERESAVNNEPAAGGDIPEQSAPSGGEQYRSGADYLFKNRNPLPAVEGSQLLDCIRIEPQDLGLLHMQNWRYGNNSFLSHGYYRYRYLLLGKLKFQDNAVKIILGVPSIYTNKEKYLANMFGFDQFVTARRTDRKHGQFGYWIVELISG